MENFIPIRKAIFEKEIRIAVFIPKQEDLINKIKKVPNRKWSNKNLCWHFPNNIDNWSMFKSLFQQFSLQIQKDLEPIRIPLEEMIPAPKLEWRKDLPLTEKGKMPAIDKTQSLTQMLETGAVEQPLNPQKITVQRAIFWSGRLRLDFIFRPDWVQFIKEIQGRKWHQDHKCWTIPHSPLTMQILLNRFGDNLEVRMNPVTATENQRYSKQKEKYTLAEKPKYQDEITLMEQQMMLKRMSFRTIKAYKGHFAQFIYYYNHISPKEITYQQIVDYIIFRVQTHQISVSEQNTIINSIKFYYEQTLGRDRTYYDIPRPNKPFQLPNVLSEEEVIKLIGTVNNIKHKCILLTIYSAGLRLSEVINLRKQDLLLDQKMISIKAGKGKKDRQTLLSDKLLEHLNIYYQHYQPVYWLFEGQDGGQYSSRSVQQILRDAVEKSKVNPLATVHTLRHSFATHLINRGVSLRHIQELLGHESSKTTEIYTHLTGEQLKKVQSPLENLKL